MGRLGRAGDSGTGRIRQTGGGGGGGGTPTAITVADTTDSTCFVGLWESATGDLGPKTDAGITYDASNGNLVIGGTFVSTTVSLGDVAGKLRWDSDGATGIRALTTSNTLAPIRGLTLESTATTGTAPLIVASTTKVANLHAALLTASDTNLTIQDDGDATKQAKFQASGITTGTTRTYTLPNNSGVVMLGNTGTTANRVLVSSGTDGVNTPTAAVPSVGDVVLADSGTQIVLKPGGDGKCDLGTPGTGFRDLYLTSEVKEYNNVATEGWGVPAIYKVGRSTAQTAAVASVAAYTVGSADGSFIVSANVLVTTSTTHNFTVTVAYTDEGNTARTLTLNFSSLAGVIATAIINTGGAVPYEGLPMHIRCKASTAITVATTGTFTSVTYNVEAVIQQVA